MLFVQEEANILPNLMREERIRAILTDAKRTFVILRTKKDESSLGEDLVRLENIKIIEEFKNITKWWISVLSFLYERPMFVCRQRYLYDCTVLYDYRLIQELKVAYELETKLSELGLKFLMSTDEEFRKLGTRSAVDKSSVCIVCGHQSVHIRSLLRNQYEEKGVYTVKVHETEERGNNVEGDAGRVYPHPNDLRLWTNILIRRRVGNKLLRKINMLS